MKTKHAFIAAHAPEHAIRFMYRVLGVAHSWFHARRRAAPKRAERAARRGRLGSEIREIFEQSKRCYGAPRIHAELKARGFRISKHTVAKLMRENGIRPPRGRRRAPITTDSRHSHAIAPNLLDRNFEQVQCVCHPARGIAHGGKNGALGLPRLFPSGRIWCAGSPPTISVW